MDLVVGSRVRSVACETELIVVRAPQGPADLRCGGAPMVALDDPAQVVALAGEHAGGTLLGKRYEDVALGLEVLCTKPGAGSLAVGDRPLAVKAAKPLPTSD